MSDYPLTSPEVNGVSEITTVAYDETGNAVQGTDALGWVVTTDYDERNRPWKVTAPRVWEAVAEEFSENMQSIMQR